MISTLLALSLVAAQPAGPSFDCRRATSDSERAICADATLSALDRDMAVAYSAARARLGPEARDALRRDQQAFLRVRENVYDRRDEPVMQDYGDLADRIAARSSFLSDVGVPREPGLIGVWGNLYGSVEVRALDDGWMSVAINTIEPTTGRWICQVEFEAVPTGGYLGGPAMSGGQVSVGVRLRDGYVEVTETWVVEAHDSGDYCGHNGFVAGDYLPIQPR